MNHKIIFISLSFFAFGLCSETLDIKVTDAANQKHYAFTLDNFSLKKQVAKLHKEVLFGGTIKSRSNSPIEFKIQKTKIGKVQVSRSIPIINGLPVFGADGVLTQNGGQNSFFYTHFQIPKTNFILNAAEAFEVAIKHNSKSILSDPYVERIEGAYEKIWLLHFGELRPVFQVRAPTLSLYDLKDIFIDAENGEVLKMKDTAMFVRAPANAFVYSPPANEEASHNGLSQVNLNSLISLEQDGFLNGEYISVKNCCKYFTCPESGECNEYTKRCALKSHPNAQQSRDIIDLPTKTLGLDPLLTLPEKITVDTVRCTYLPFARASISDKNGSDLGFFDIPLDNDTSDSEMERFSEIQAYFSTMSFFNHIRFLLQDNTWCLRSQAMSCDEQGRGLKDSNNRAQNPYRVFVNQLMPDLKTSSSNQSDPGNFLVQILAGKGTKTNPVVLNNLKRLGNAAFVPALSTLKKTQPRADELLSDLIKPFDHNVFFQGQRDFAYDGDVVFHEFMHGITTTLLNNINSLGLSQWGINAEPGALNEGWSDYFSASFTNSSKIGEYASIEGGFGEVASRDLHNQKNCPDDIIGEIHSDSQVWSGALWEIKNEVESRLGRSAKDDFDRAVLTSLSQANVTENFDLQVDKLLDNISQKETLGEPIKNMAENIFLKRGVKNCFGAFTLSTADSNNNLTTREKDLLFVPSKNIIGLKNYAPSTLQLEIGAPAGAKKMIVSWRQFLSGTGALLGAEATPDSTSNIIPLGVLSSLDLPIKWEFQKAFSVPTKKGEKIEFPIEDKENQAEFRNGYWQFTKELNFNDCDQRMIYLSFLSRDFKYVLENISVRFEKDESADLDDCTFQGSQRNIEFSEPEESGCTQTPVSELMLLILLGLIGLRRKSRII